MSADRQKKIAARVRLAGACAVSLLVSPAMAHPEETAQTENIMVVLDASGSMWGQIDGTTKIEIVRSAVLDLADSWQEKQVNVGLIAYGHRRKGDCGDIEVLSDVKPVVSEVFSSTVNKLNPKGKTPLGAAVRLAAEELKYTEEKATVVLLSDGIETCQVDPCALGAELEKLGIDFTTHVIGFDISSEEEGQLACLAENTGGRYIPARNATELNDALTQTTEVVDADVEQAPTLGSGELVAVLADSSEIAGSTSWQLIGDAGVFELETLGANLSLTELEAYGAAPGTYKVLARHKEFEGKAEVTFPLDDRTELRLERAAPDVVFTVEGDLVAFNEFTVSWTEQSPGDNAIAIVPTGASATGDTIMAQASASESGTARLTAPAAGTYDLVYLYDRYSLRRIDARQPITFTEAEFSLTPVGDLWAGEDFLVEWTGPGAASDIIAIGPRGTGGSDYTSVDYASNGSPAELTAPDEPGAYELRYYGRNYTLLFTQPVTVE